MKIALVYDRVNKIGGAERILSALHEIWPQAPLYTVFYNANKAGWSKTFNIITSFINKLPFVSGKHEFFSFLSPIAFEAFDFKNFDIVISVTSGDAKSILIKPSTLHLCYCLTPTRYIWSGYFDYLGEPGLGSFSGVIRWILKTVVSCFRQYDYLSSKRPDKYIAISKTVKKRISRYYKQNSVVIFPPVDTEFFRPGKIDTNLGYFLIVSRLVSYKKLDYIIEAFKDIDVNLKIIGTGSDENRLKKLASNNIEFLGGDLTDEKLCWYYQNCLSLIFPGEEDFGLSAVEAQSCGKPVIGYKEGGMNEIVADKITGILYSDRSIKNVIKIIKEFDPGKYKSKDCRKNAMRFSKKLFIKKFKTEVNQLWKEYRKHK